MEKRKILAQSIEKSFLIDLLTINNAPWLVNFKNQLADSFKFPCGACIPTNYIEAESKRHFWTTNSPKGTILIKYLPKRS